MQLTKLVSFDIFGDYVEGNREAIVKFNRFLDNIEKKHVQFVNRIIDDQPYIQYVSTPRTDKVIAEWIRVFSYKL